MPFDPSFPPLNANMMATSFRDQFNALNDKIDAQATLIGSLTARLTALEPRLATGFGDPRANGQYEKVGTWNGWNLYLNTVSGFCLCHDGMSAWVIWDGDVRVGGAISSQYYLGYPGPTGTYTETNGIAPGGTIS